MGQPAKLINGKTAAAPRPGIGVRAGIAMTARGAAMASAIMEENIIVVAEYGVCLVLFNKFLKRKRATGLLFG
jgi:hypothetical protein